MVFISKIVIVQQHRLFIYSQFVNGHVPPFTIVRCTLSFSLFSLSIEKMVLFWHFCWTLFSGPEITANRAQDTYAPVKGDHFSKLAHSLWHLTNGIKTKLSGVAKRNGMRFYTNKWAERENTNKQWNGAGWAKKRKFTQNKKRLSEKQMQNNWFPLCDWSAWSLFFAAAHFPWNFSLQLVHFFLSSFIT